MNAPLDLMRLRELARLRAIPELSNAEIASRLGLSQNAMRRAVEHAKLPRRPNRRPTGLRPTWKGEDKDEVIAAYTDGAGGAELARRFGKTRSAIMGLLSRNGIRRGAPPPVTQHQLVEFPPPGHCVWPSGEMQQASLRFCGTQAVPGKPYCLKHISVSSGRPLAASK